MPYNINRRSLQRLRAFILAGQFIDTAWTFTATDSNALLGSPPNWTDYQLHFLGIGVGVPNDGGTLDTVRAKGDFAYPFAKNDDGANLDALRQIVRQAKTAGDMDVMEAALAELDRAEAMVADSKIASAAPEICIAARASVQAAAGKVPTFTADCYHGGKIMVDIDGKKTPIVFDYAGLDFTSKSRPALRDHDPERPIGHTDSFSVVSNVLKATGQISFVSPDAQEVIDAGKNNFPWQISVGVNPIEEEFIPRGQTGQANGQTFPGPLLIIRQGILKEVSFLALGADDNTSAKIAASAPNKRNSMLTTYSKTKPVITARTIAAAAARSMLHYPEAQLLKEFGERVMDGADSLGCVGLKGIYALCADTENGRCDYSDGDDLIQAALSTESLPAVLQNIANKAVIQSYRAVGAVADVICSQGPDLKDFRTASRIRLTSGGRFERVGPSGEVKNLSVSDTSSYEVTGQTYGSILRLDRQMVMNDDAGAFLGLPKIVGRNAAMIKEQVLFTLILANANSYFGSGNKNYISGSGTAFAAGSVAKLSKLFREQTDKDGNLTLQVPRFVMVPPALEQAALANYRLTAVEGAATVNDGASEFGADVPIARYTPVVAPYLGTAGGLTGASDTAWYMGCNPADIAAFEVAYLGGQKYPTFRQCPPQAEYLNMQLLAIFDFAIGPADPRGMTMSLGDA